MKYTAYDKYKTIGFIEQNKNIKSLNSFITSLSKYLIGIHNELGQMIHFFSNSP